MTAGTLGIIGAGNMGGAILEGVIKAALFRPDGVVVCDIVAEKARSMARKHGVGLAQSASEAARQADIVLIAVKPQTMAECLSEMKTVIKPSQLIISIAAGITTDFIASRLSPGTRIIRVMPNTPALVGAGVSAICSGAHATEHDMAEAERIFSALGKVYRFPESLIDVVTAVSGSGPAYLFLFAEQLTQAGVKCGLPETEAPGIVAQTLFGASKLLIESGESASALRAKVTSPGGTTEAAVKTFTDRAFGETVFAAVNSALTRAKELGGVKKS
ncbi:pyrroline-5-carboxylate reductase [Candidatus Poribacteria bacterium]|nr:pyrroline-5-carboxylate reductase [Candidatus Poribacteria bacterium]